VVISTKDESTVPIPLAMIDLLKVDWWRPVVDLKSTIASQSKRQAQVPNLESVNEKIRCIEVDYPIVSCNKAVTIQEDDFSRIKEDSYRKAFDNISNIVVLGDEQLRLQEIP
ncbi:hypothetical protein Tco_0445898, partial [Tanacetum coccineum]